MSSTSSSRFSSDKSNGGFDSNGAPKLTPRPSPRPSLEPSPSTRRRHKNKSIKYRNTNIFPMDLLDMGQTLGKGAYGKVYKGKLKLGPNLRVEVAVKTSTRSTGTEDLEREAHVFMKLPTRHLNIVNLMGVCLPTEADMHPLLLLELCEGNLEKLLQKNKEDFLPPDTKHLKIISESGQLNSKLLVKYSYQVSRGMEFLEQHKIVHGDLAARNILLAQKGTVAKVSDFGLSHSLYASVEELNNTSGGLPVRWMAPEVLMNRQVNNKSDIWSFGVLLWEMFSLGAVPYPEIPQIDLQFIQDLNDGLRYLGSPLYKVGRVQEDMDAIRLSTLKVAQEERPSFEELSPRLWLVLEEASKTDYTQLEDDYKRYITLVEDSYEKMMAAKNSKRAPERTKDRGTARKAQKSGRGEDSGGMFRKVSYI